MKIPVTAFVLAAFAASLISCGSEEQTFVPKPKGYNRIELPAHAYRMLDKIHPYDFEYSKFSRIVPDTFAMAGKDWIFVHYPQLNANIQITYKPLQNNPKLLGEFINDSYKLAAKHQIRASSIQEQRITTPSGNIATIFRIEGDVPSPFQFYTTDSTTHFMRGAVYFPTATKNDSLAPVIAYIQEDMLRLLNTLQWRKK
ncbi:gliding motility lipoprotein GldD [Dyadobacter sandarakinus]|uniref:Gliding motility lipoprotein GldD n=1 Tax=Dyadobacter sandarakinus TaxID=2747268 RepID=A0ABX7IDA0_9BACT|nr:gliding motility lipoprotein GldD [Dyadobacter sandarakinus]QRR03502.1 gliding motility lipoprotein GldD [Dyadobacter sandarakinus]